MNPISLKIAYLGGGQRTKLFRQQIEFQCKHIGGLRIPLDRSILMDKALDECLASFVGQSLVAKRIFLFIQNTCDVCKQAGTVRKKSCSDQLLGSSTFTSIAAVQGEPVTKTTPACIFGITADPIPAGLG